MHVKNRARSNTRKRVCVKAMQAATEREKSVECLCGHKRVGGKKGEEKGKERRRLNVQKKATM